MKKICAFIMIMMFGLSFGGQKVLAAVLLLMEWRVLVEVV